MKYHETFLESLGIPHRNLFEAATTKHSRFYGINFLVDDVQRGGDGAELFPVTVAIGMDTEHNLEEPSQGELYRAFIIIYLVACQEAQESFLLLLFLCFLSCFTFCFQFLRMMVW